MTLRRWAGIVGIGIAIMGSPARAADRVALVIANSHYEKTVELRTPQADSLIVAQALRAAGFDSVTVVSDATKAKFEQSLQRFADESQDAEVALLYYAGHGIEVNGENYLVPTDADIQRDGDAGFQAISLASVRQLLETARLRVIVLDACRNNPFPRMQVKDAKRAMSSGGLRPIEPIDGEAVLYSTREGTRASDGAGKYSPFARAFAGRVAQPDLEIGILFRKVRDDVRREEPDQEPFAYNSLSGDPFYFVRSDGPIPAPGKLAVADLPRPKIAPPKRFAGPSEPTQALVPMNRAMPGGSTGVAASVPAATNYLASIVLPQLGLTVRPASDGSAFAVDAVSSSGVAVGQVFAGDVIVGINSAPPVAGRSPTEQLVDPLSQQGRLRLLIRRGTTSSVVILRQ